MVKKEKYPLSFKLLQGLFTVFFTLIFIRTLLSLSRIYSPQASINSTDLRFIIELATLFSLLKRKRWGLIMEIILNISGMLVMLITIYQKKAIIPLTWILFSLILSTFIVVMLLMHRKYYNK